MASRAACSARSAGSSSAAGHKAPAAAVRAVRAPVAATAAGTAARVPQHAAPRQQRRIAARGILDSYRQQQAGKAASPVASSTSSESEVRRGRGPLVRRLAAHEARRAPLHARAVLGAAARPSRFSWQPNSTHHKRTPHRMSTSSSRCCWTPMCTSQRRTRPAPQTASSRCAAAAAHRCA